MSDGFGLRKDERLADKREREAAEAREVEPLTTPFPYDIVPFDPEFFALPANPPLL